MDALTLTDRALARIDEARAAATAPPESVTINEPAAYPLHALGGTLGEAAHVIADGAQVDPAIVGQSLLGAASFAVQHAVDVLTATGPKPTSLFLITLALSGDGKSAVDGIALAPIRASERDEWVSYEQERAEWEGVPKKDRGDKPVNPLRLVADFTAEGLVRQFREGRPSLGAFSDEAGAVFGGHSFSPEKKLATAAGLTGLWDGAGIRARARASDERGGLEARFDVRLAAHWLIQPAAADTIIHDPILSEQGFWPRTLLATPPAGQPRAYRAFHADHEPVIGRYWSRLSALLQLPVVAPQFRPVLRPTPEAEQLVASFFETCDLAARGRDGRLRPIRAWASRATEQLLRVAGVLTVFEHGTDADIGVLEIERAAEIVYYSLECWLSMVEHQPEREATAYAWRLLAWLKEQPGRQSNETAMLRIGPKPRSQSLRDTALAILEGKKLVANLGGKQWGAV